MPTPTPTPAPTPGYTSVVLTWDANPEPDIAGYHVRIGTVPGQPATIIDVGNTTRAVISNLWTGTTYYFSVTAYNTASTESLPSAEVSFTTSGVAPAPTPTPAPTAAPNPPVVSGPNLTVNTTSTNVGAVVQVTLNNGMQNTSDTIALLPAGQNTPVDWFYLNGTKTAPQSGIPSTTLSFTMPSNGQFLFRYNSGTLALATSPQIQVAGASLSPTPTPSPANKNLSNVSTRANVQTGDNVVIGGFIITGTLPKRVIVRALGPSLAAAGITNTLSNPTLTLYSVSGAVLASNDDWRSSPDAAAIAAIGLAPSSDSESALMATLIPGAYSAKIAGVNGTKGVALIEVDDTENSGSRIGNISTRGRVETGNNMMIGGFIINGSQSSQVLVRALGPSLAKYGLTGTLSDPTLEIYNGNGSKIFSNDNWKSSQKTQITATSLAPTDDRESAILATLAPGNYSAMVRGAKNTVGVALVEVYSIGN